VTISARKSQGARRTRQKVEATIIPINGPIIRAEDSEESLYAAIDVVYDKLNKQLRRYKNKLKGKYQAKGQESIRFQNIETDAKEEQSGEFDIVIERHKKFDMKPMSPEEAVLQMELIGHDFYMFRNIDTDEISTVYKRENGGYGLIEHE
ncbi:MAG: ribosome hibernation-promoting factor, HPF/YfiA family, partial [Intestinibacter sp.]